MSELTNYQRLSLINQFEILQKQGADEDYSLQIEILEEGLEGFYDEEVFVRLSSQKSEDERQFVSNVLNLYRDAIFSYEKLEEKDKTEKLKRDITFYGFDLNDINQLNYYSYAKFYLYSLNRYKEIAEQLEERNEELNSHGSEPSINELNKYVGIREEIRKNKPSNEPLSKEDLEYIFE